MNKWVSYDQQVSMQKLSDAEIYFNEQYLTNAYTDEELQCVKEITMQINVIPNAQKSLFLQIEESTIITYTREVQQQQQDDWDDEDDEQEIEYVKLINCDTHRNSDALRLIKRLYKSKKYCIFFYVLRDGPHIPKLMFLATAVLAERFSYVLQDACVIMDRYICDYNYTQEQVSTAQLLAVYDIETNKIVHFCAFGKIQHDISSVLSLLINNCMLYSQIVQEIKQLVR